MKSSIKFWMRWTLLTPIKIMSMIDDGKTKRRFFEYFLRSKSIKQKKTFSQFGEDAVLSFFLHEQKGRYLDIGAGHYMNGSNTYSFYLKGWRGICVEPIPKLCKLLQKKRPGDNVIQRIVTYEPKKMLFFEFDPYEYSTTDSEVVKNLEKSGFSPVREWEIESISINDLSLQVNPIEPFFLTIDCEGLDTEIIKSIQFEDFSPRVICCEIFPSDTSGRNEIEDFLKSKNYRLMAICVFSLIYVHNDYLNKQDWSRYL